MSLRETTSWQLNWVQGLEPWMRMGTSFSRECTHFKQYVESANAGKSPGSSGSEKELRRHEWKSEGTGTRQLGNAKLTGIGSGSRSQCVEHSVQYLLRAHEKEASITEKLPKLKKQFFQFSKKFSIFSRGFSFFSLSYRAYSFEKQEMLWHILSD